MIDSDFQDASRVFVDSRGPAPLGTDGRIALADERGDTPETAIAIHLLRRGLARAYTNGPPFRFAAAIIQNLAFSSDEVTAYGSDAVAIWDIRQRLPGWSCVLGDAIVAEPLGEVMRNEIGRPVRILEDVYYVLQRPEATSPLMPVRLLSTADEPLLARAPADLRGAGFPSLTSLPRRRRRRRDLGQRHRRHCAHFGAIPQACRHRRRHEAGMARPRIRHRGGCPRCPAGAVGWPNARLEHRGHHRRVLAGGGQVGLRRGQPPRLCDSRTLDFGARAAAPPAMRRSDLPQHRVASRRGSKQTPKDGLKEDAS